MENTYNNNEQLLLVQSRSLNAILNESSFLIQANPGCFFIFFILFKNISCNTLLTNTCSIKQPV